MKTFNHVGKKYGTWSVVSSFIDNEKKKYILRCDCGVEKIVPSQKMYRSSLCLACKPKKTLENYIGQKHGNLTVISYVKYKNRHGLRLRCDCGTECNVGGYSHFLKNTSCNLCKRGYFPGKIVGNTILLTYLGDRKWEKKCECGQIFISRASKTDCGCILRDKVLAEAEKKVGKTFFLLTVKKVIGRDGGHILLLIRCKCGTEFIRHNGHEFKSNSCGCVLKVPTGENSNAATLKNIEVKSMRELHESGLYTKEQLAEMFNKPASYINRILKRTIWKHV